MNMLNQSYDDHSWLINLAPALDYRISSALQLNINASYLKNHNYYQYVQTITLGSDKYYLMGHLEQQTFGITLRLDYYVTPDLSIRYYGSPFISTGIYSGFKKVMSPRASNIDNRCYSYEPDEILYNTLERKYYVDEDRDGLTDFSFKNPDFNFMQFRSNFVVRWEFKPGSNIYFVWTHDRTGLENSSFSGISQSFSDLFNIYPDNIFLVKFNYWFTL